MRPILFELELPLAGKVTFPAYMTLLVIAFVVAALVARRHAARLGMDRESVTDLGLLMLVLGVLGARLMAVLTDGQLGDFINLCVDPTRVRAVDSLVAACSSQTPCDFHYVCNLATQTCHPPRDCLAALKFWHGGLTYYGGLVLAVPGGLWYARRVGLDPWRTADIAAPCIMLGLALGRLGCFLHGCCHGAPTESVLGVSVPGHSTPLHPVQIYEATAALALFGVLRGLVWPRARGAGEVFAWMLVLYGAARIFLELVRADPRGALGPFSTSQLVSVPLIAAGVWAIVQIRARARPEANSTQILPPVQ